jgi:hypothetical protein
MIVFQISILFSLGGSDTGSRTRRMLSKLMTDKLMVEYNYAGRGPKGKQAFKLLPSLPNVMLGKLLPVIVNIVLCCVSQSLLIFDEQRYVIYHLLL